MRYRKFFWLFTFNYQLFQFQLTPNFIFHLAQKQTYQLGATSYSAAEYIFRLQRVNINLMMKTGQWLLQQLDCILFLLR